MLTDKRDLFTLCSNEKRQHILSSVHAAVNKYVPMLFESTNRNTKKKDENFRDFPPKQTWNVAKSNNEKKV